MKRFGIENYFFECNFLIQNPTDPGCLAIYNNIMEKKLEVMEKMDYFLGELVAMGYEGSHEIPRADETIKTFKAKKMISKTDWEKVKSMTEKEIISAAKSDPDAQPLTDAQLKKFKRVEKQKENK